MIVKEGTLFEVGLFKEVEERCLKHYFSQNFSRTKLNRNFNLHAKITVGPR